MVVAPHSYANFQPHKGSEFGAFLSGVTTDDCVLFFVYGYKELEALLGEAYQLSPSPEIITEIDVNTNWTHVFDFTVNNGGWSGTPLCGALGGAAYIAGSGWFIGGGGVGRDFDGSFSLILTTDYEYHVTTGATSSAAVHVENVLLDNICAPIVPVNTTTEVWANGDTKHRINVNGTDGFPNAFEILTQTSFPFGGGVIIRLSKVTVTGIGVDPF